MLLIFVWLLSYCHASDNKQEERYRFKFNLELTYNIHQISTKASDSTETAESSVSFLATEFGMDYFASKSLAITAQFVLPMMVSIDAELSGYDIGARYYFRRPGAESEAKLLGSMIESSPGWAPFIYGGFSGRTYQFSNSNISFQGIEAGGGFDYHLQGHYFVRSGISYQYLQNTSKRSLTGVVGGMSLGRSF
jgi:hypothetical protein